MPLLPTLCACENVEWRMQDFPDGVTNPRWRNDNLLYCNIFAEKCVEMKEIGPRDGSVPRTPRSATATG